MSYLGLNLDSLVWELKSLMKNNYGKFEKNHFNRHFRLAKKDIIERFEDIIEQNREEVRKEISKKGDFRKMKLLKQTQERSREDCLKEVERMKEKKEVLKYEILEQATFQGLPFLLKIVYQDK